MRSYVPVFSRPFIFLIAVVFCAFSSQAQAQFNFTSNNGTVTITGYTGSSSTVVIPGQINFQPVTTIAPGAFESISMTSVTIPSNVTTIGANAFEDCFLLASVTIPANVTSIGAGAFQNCSSLATVTIPAKVTSLGALAFDNCSNLTAINVNATNTAYSSVGGVLFNKNQTTLLEYPAGLAGNYTIPNTVTAIAASAFDSCTNLTGVTMPASVTSIGAGAFQSCSSLTAINVNSGSTAYSSVGGVLFNHSQSTLIIYPGGLGGSYTIPSGVTSIGDNAFANSGLTGVTIPNTVTTIGAAAFADTNLINVIIPNSVTSIGADTAPNGVGTFFGCDSLTSVSIGNNVTTIGANTFDACASLSSITIPSSVTSLGELAFANMPGLANVYFQGNAPSADVTVFSGSAGATIYYLPGMSGWGSIFANVVPVLLTQPIPVGSLQVTITPSGALTAGAQWQVDEGPLQNSGATVGNLSVGNHTVSFSTVNGWTPPDNQLILVSANATTTASGNYIPQEGSLTVTISPTSAVSAGALWQVDGGANRPSGSLVTNLPVGNHTVSFTTLNGWTSPANLTVTINNDVTTNATATYFANPQSGQFSYTINNDGSINITGFSGSGATLVIPSTINSQAVTSIGNFAFSFVSGVTNITIPSSVTSIGIGAFQGTTITTMTIPSSVTTIGDFAFADCTALTSITIPNGVTTLGNEVFYFCPKLTTVTIPASVTSIGVSPFIYCSTLSAINVNSANPAFSSAGGVLFDKSQATLLDYPAGLNGSYTTIPGTVTAIGAGAFNACTLSSVTLPASVTSIALGAFNYCASLTAFSVSTSNPAFSSNSSGVLFNKTKSTLVIYPDGLSGAYAIPGSVTSIATGAFDFCANLTAITIPSSVTSIGANAFQGTGLTSVSIPSSVTFIGGAAFNDCLSLTAFAVDSSNPAYSNSVDGILFDQGQDTLVEFPGGLSGNYTIPGTVTSIGDYAFANTKLGNVTIPTSVTSIGNESFYACTNLVTISIPAKVTSIGTYGFGSCLNLSTANFLGNAPSADSTAFYNDTLATAYYLTGTSGWGSSFGGIPAMLLSQPGFSTQPASQAVVAGENATFTAEAASGSAATYQWQVSTDGGNTWSNATGTLFSGSMTATLTVTEPALTLSGYQFRVVATNSSTPPITSSSVALVVGFSSGYLSWLNSNFTSIQLGTPSVIATSATPANDGIPNLLKYALGLSPLQNARNQLPQPTSSNGILSLTFPAAHTDVTYSVQASTDLINWSTTGVTTTANGSTETATYPLPVSGPAFLRIVVAP